MPIQNETDERRTSMDEPRPAAPAGAATTPVASGQAGGIPVGVVGEVGTPPVRPAPDDDRDPAEAAFERLTGHKTDERPSTETSEDHPNR
jgi:hypothetical protein